MNINISKEKGMTLIEVLVAIVIVSTSLLAVALYGLVGLQENQTAYVRSQANFLAYEMADRIRSNAGYALDDDNNYSMSTSDVSSIPNAVNCANATGCDEAALASLDIREWAENFIDVVGIGADGATYESLIPDGVGDVEVDGQEVVITISWNDTNWNTASGANRGDSTSRLQLELKIAE